MSTDLTGKTVVVTGASSGIGRSISERVGSAGATVYLIGRSAEPMAESKTKIEAAGGSAETVAMDVRDSAALQAAIERAASETGRLDVMVNNAGLGDSAPVLGGNVEFWREMFEVNVIALLVGCQTAVEVMRAKGNGGRIINISSNAALHTNAGVYGATKHAVNAITRSLRDELEDDDIRVTSVMPGVIATNFARNLDPETVKGIGAMAGVDLDLAPGEKIPEEALEKTQALLERQIGVPEDIADAVDYILGLPLRLNVPEIVVRPAKQLAF